MCVCMSSHTHSRYVDEICVCVTHEICGRDMCVCRDEICVCVCLVRPWTIGCAV
jgi:hypothetical protein